LNNWRWVGTPVGERCRSGLRVDSTEWPVPLRVPSMFGPVLVEDSMIGLVLMEDSMTGMVLMEDSMIGMVLMKDHSMIVPEVRVCYMTGAVVLVMRVVWEPVAEQVRLLDAEWTMMTGMECLELVPVGEPRPLRRGGNNSNTQRLEAEEGWSRN
jgi:hypothetical protein